MSPTMNRVTQPSASAGPLEGWTAQPDWPEEEPVRAIPEPPRGRFARVVRALGDAFIIGGMSKGMTGDRDAAQDRSISNVMLFGEGAAKGRDANRDSRR